jgi:hypothetical protein
MNLTAAHSLPPELHLAALGVQCPQALRLIDGVEVIGLALGSQGRPAGRVLQAPLTAASAFTRARLASRPSSRRQDAYNSSGIKHID